VCVQASCLTAFGTLINDLTVNAFCHFHIHEKSVHDWPNSVLCGAIMFVLYTYQMGMMVAENSGQS